MIFQEADDKIQAHDIRMCFFNRYFNVQEYCTPVMVDVADYWQMMWEMFRARLATKKSHYEYRL